MQIQNEPIGSTSKVGRRDQEHRPADRWLGGLAAVFSSAVGAVCPACIPAVGSLLAAIGLGFAAKEQFMHPLLIVFLSTGIGSLAWATRRHRRRWILGAGIVGAVLLYAGRYVWLGEPGINQIATWAGVVTLLGASLANFRVKRGCNRCGGVKAFPAQPARDEAQP